MKGYGERAWSRRGKVKENRIKRLGDKGSEKALFALKTKAGVKEGQIK